MIPAALWKINSEALIARDEDELGIDDIDRLIDEVSNAEAADNYKKALDLLDLILAIERRELGLDHSDIGGTLAWKGSIYQQQGLYENAEDLLRLGLEIQEKQLGVGQLDTAGSISCWYLCWLSMIHYIIPVISVKRLQFSGDSEKPNSTS